MPGTDRGAIPADRSEGLLDLSRPRRIHVVGVGGAGMSAIASVLAAMGHAVSGSDLKTTPSLERLVARGVDVTVGHDAANLGQAEVVTFSTAIPASNPELRAAEVAGVPRLRRADMLAAIVATRRSVAVAGTHGKTTTSSMLALVLQEAGLHPSFIIGGELNEIGTGAAWTDGEWLVVEADESDGTFLELPADAVVVTSVEADHLEQYGGRVENLERAFAQFLAGAPGPRVVCADDPVAARLGAAADAVTYGTAPDADYAMESIVTGRSSVRFRVRHHGRDLGDVALPVPGVHNAQNACCAVATGMELGASFEAAARGLARYGGVARRFQFRGEAGGVSFVDDYAHLPGEVRMALATAKAGGWNRVVCVFQPHRFSRTAALAPDFADAFVDADVVVVTDVYPAGEAPRPGVTGRLIVDAVLGAHPDAAVGYVADRRSWAAEVGAILGAGDVCLTLGAGDLTDLADEFLSS